jgi:hypothetical protein
MNITELSNEDLASLRDKVLQTLADNVAARQKELQAESEGLEHSSRKNPPQRVLSGRSSMATARMNGRVWGPNQRGRSSRAIYSNSIECERGLWPIIDAQDDRSPIWSEAPTFVVLLRLWVSQRHTLRELSMATLQGLMVHKPYRHRMKNRASLVVSRQCFTYKL